MPKKKKEKDAAATKVIASAGSDSAAQESVPTENVSVVRNLSLSFHEYVLLNILFDVFCLVQLILVRLFIRETRGMYFFFGMLMIGFLLVSIFDYLYERTQARTHQEDAQLSKG